MIERLYVAMGKVREVTTVIPGHQEVLTPRGFTRNTSSSYDRYTRSWISVDSDDSITIIHDLANGSGSQVKGSATEVSLTKLEINEHTVQSAKGFFGRYVIFEWVPQIKYVQPEEETAIQRLLTAGTWTEEAAESARENLIYEAQMRRKALKLRSPQERLLPPPK